MKKVLLGILFCASGAAAFAQGSVTQKPGGGEYIADPSIEAKKAGLRAGEHLEKWYNWMDAAEENLGISFTSYNNMFIFPEANVVQQYGDGNGGTLLDTVGIFSDGQVFDPKAPAFQDSALTRFNPYKWDSVAFYTYSYNRFPENPNPDTLIFDFSTTTNPSNFTKWVIPTGNDKSAYIKYDYKKNRADGAKASFTYLLTDADTGLLHPIIIPVDDANGGLALGPDGLCAVTISFHPGYTWKPGDTLDYRANPMKKLNSLRLFVRRDASKTSDESYNSGLRVVRDNRYNTSTNGWNGKYIPGDAWLSYNENLYMFFHINTDHFGIQESDMKGYGVSEVYPNPVNGKGTIDFKLGKAEKVNITLYNALGQPVQVIANGGFAAGPNSVGVDANSLKPGMYFYTITAGSYVKTMKMNVAR